MKYYYIFLFASFLFLSCSDESLVNVISLEKASSGVSSIKTHTMDMTQVIGVEDNVYDIHGKILKKTFYGGDRGTVNYYENYYYDNNGRLIYKIKNNRNIHSSTGFTTLDSTVYNYSNNLLISEKTIFPPENISEEITYEYKGTMLITEKYSYRSGNTSKITYEYNNGIIQSKYSYDSNDKLIGVFKYIYSGKYLSKILRYSSDKELMISSAYEYRNGKLMKETCEVIALYLSNSSYVALYEY